MYLDHMSDEEAGRLFKLMLSIRNGRGVEIPEEFRFVMPTVLNFWEDQDALDQRLLDQRREAALSRWHKSGDVVADNWTASSSGSTTHTPKKKLPSVIDYSPEFESFWSVYPKRKGKARAWEAWCRLISGGQDASYLIRKATDYAKECSLKHVEEHFIKRPQGWLNDCRFDDDYFTGTTQVDLDAITDGLDSVI